jgi:hypothetical protein
VNNIYIKLLAPFVLLLAQISKYTLEYKWKDHKTKSHKNLRILFLISIVIITLITGIIIVVDTRANEKYEQVIEDINNNMLISKESENNAIQQRDNIQEELTNLSTKIELLVKIARRFNPDFTEVEALDYISGRVDYAIEMSTRDIPKKSSLFIDEELLKGLIKWHAENKNVKVNLKLLNGGDKNTKKALDILEFTLKKAGINPIISISMMGINSSGKIFTVEYPNKLEESAKSLLDILSKKFIGDASFSVHNEDSIWIWIYGFPDFLSDGRIIYN